jgi:hypothetical protein
MFAPAPIVLVYGQVNRPAPAVENSLRVPFAVAWIAGALGVVGFSAVASLAWLPLANALHRPGLSIWLAVSAASGVAFMVGAAAAWQGRFWARWVALVALAADVACTVLSPGVSAAELSQRYRYGLTPQAAGSGIADWIIAGCWWLLVGVGVTFAFSPAFHGYCLTRDESRGIGQRPSLSRPGHRRPALTTAGCVLAFLGAGVAYLWCFFVMWLSVVFHSDSFAFNAKTAGLVTKDMLTTSFMVATIVLTLRGLAWAWLALVVQCIEYVGIYLPYLIASGVHGGASPNFLELVMLAGPVLTTVFLLVKPTGTWLFGTGPAPRPFDWWPPLGDGPTAGAPEPPKNVP